MRARPREKTGRGVGFDWQSRWNRRASLPGAAHQVSEREKGERGSGFGLKAKEPHSSLPVSGVDQATGSGLLLENPHRAKKTKATRRTAGAEEQHATGGRGRESNPGNPEGAAAVTAAMPQSGGVGECAGTVGCASSALPAELPRRWRGPDANRRPEDWKGDEPVPFTALAEVGTIGFEPRSPHPKCGALPGCATFRGAACRTARHHGGGGIRTRISWSR